MLFKLVGSNSLVDNPRVIFHTINQVNQLQYSNDIHNKISSKYDFKEQKHLSNHDEGSSYSKNIFQPSTLT